MKASYREVAYLRLLEHLTSSDYSTNDSRAATRHRIEALKQLADDLGVPSYRYIPSPVASYFDPSIMHADARDAMQRKADAPV